MFEMYSQARKHPSAPAFSGGVLDSWPSVYVDGFAICRQEEEAVAAWLKATTEKPVRSDVNG